MIINPLIYKNYVTANEKIDDNKILAYNANSSTFVDTFKINASIGDFSNWIGKSENYTKPFIYHIEDSVTATAADIVLGKTAIINSGLVTGTNEGSSADLEDLIGKFY